MNFNKCDRFYISWDMNGDFLFTISDLSLQFEFLFFLPARLIIFAFDRPKLATFFEIDCQTGLSWGGGLFSLAIWFGVAAGFIEWLDSLWKK